MLTPTQLIAARGLLRWSRDDLAMHAGTSSDAIYDFESRGRSPTLRTVQKWIAALHSAGVVLIDEAEDHGPGVMLRKGVHTQAPVDGAPGARRRKS